MSAASILAEGADWEEARAAVRRPIYMPSTIRALGHATERLLLLNLSKTGFMGETRRVFERGSFIEVVLPGVGHVRGRIVWCERGRVGGQFLKRI